MVVRMKLGKLSGERRRFTCLFLRRETRVAKSGKSLATVLLTDVRRRGELLADHIWVEDGYWSRDVLEGDMVRVEGRVDEYVKTFRGESRLDYRIRDLWLLRNYTAEAAESPAA